jgi:hypothetical protein
VPQDRLNPERRAGEYVFVADARGIEPQATVWEPEGPCAVVERAAADAAGLEYDFVAAWIVLRFESALDMVGLTAAFSAALAERGIPCNVLAGLRHDHLLVPVDRADEAVAALQVIGVPNT